MLFTGHVAGPMCAAREAQIQSLRSTSLNLRPERLLEDPAEELQQPKGHRNHR